jgi:three-Cys-motif partner protein
MPQPKDTLWNSEPRTLIKHQVYQSYLGCWMGKICRSFQYATIVDAFAGPGAYLDGVEGSPVVIAKTFLGHRSLARFGRLQLICQEKRPDRRDHLQGLLDSLPADGRLRREVRPAGDAVACLAELRAAAHPRNGADWPVLWIIDPFGWEGAPFQLVAACLANRRDEVLVTWFADELYRFRNDPTKADAITRHFGGEHWRTALTSDGDSAGKEALLDAYQQGLRRLPGVRTAHFSISSRNETARYSLILATHSDHGLECFNGPRWRLDPFQGKAVNEYRGTEQTDLLAGLPVTDALRQSLKHLSGQHSFRQLAQDAIRLGYKESHLRAVLTELAQDGLAIREYPLASPTPWPKNALIRFYHPPSQDR